MFKLVRVSQFKDVVVFFSLFTMYAILSFWLSLPGNKPCIIFVNAYPWLGGTGTTGAQAWSHCSRPRWSLWSGLRRTVRCLFGPTLEPGLHRKVLRFQEPRMSQESKILENLKYVT